MVSTRSWAAAAQLLLVLPLSVLALPTTPESPQFTTKRVFQYGNSSYQLENLAVRSNGNILVATSFPEATVGEFNPSIGNSSYQLVVNNAQLNGSSFTLGLAELYPDVFAVASGTVNQTGTFTIHTLDFTAPGLPVVKLTNNVPSATLLNKLAPLPNGILLASDTYLGRILRIDTLSGTYTEVLNGTAFEAEPGATGAGLLAVNGLQIRGGCLYFINSGKQSFSRIAISSSGYPRGSPELIANVSSIQSLPDDFAFAPDGTAYISGSDEIVRVLPNGKSSVLVGGPTVSTVAGDTSARFGRGSQKESDTLYVSTGPSPGTGIPPGFVEAIQFNGTPS